MSEIEVTRQEVLHSRKILPAAELFWGWATPSGKKRAERRANFFIEFGKITNNSKVLELGCGTGVFTKKVGQTGADVIAIDISPYFIKKAKEEVIADNVVFQVGDVGHLRFKDDIFDCVVGSSILHHLVELKSALIEIKRVLKKGGQFVFTEPNMLNPQIMIMKKVRFIGRILGDSPSETAFFKWQVTNLFRQVGFASVFVEPFDFLHPWIPSPMIKPIEKTGLILEKLPLIREIAGSLVIYGEK